MPHHVLQLTVEAEDEAAAEALEQELANIIFGRPLLLSHKGRHPDGTSSGRPSVFLEVRSRADRPDREQIQTAIRNRLSQGSGPWARAGRGEIRTHLCTHGDVDVEPCQVDVEEIVGPAASRGGVRRP